MAISLNHVFFPVSLVWQTALNTILTTVAMKKKPVRGESQSCSKFQTLCCYTWKQNTVPYLRNSESKRELIELLNVCMFLSK